MLSSLYSRLYVRIYLALLGSLALAALLFALVHWAYDPAQGLESAAEFASQVLPPASAPRAEQELALRRWRNRTQINLTLYSAERVVVASAGRPLPPLPPGQTESGRVPGRLAVYALKLPDGRWLLCQRMRRQRLPLSIIMILGMVALVVAVGAYPVVRRLTRRLERLQRSVDTWGGGQLATRVAVEGRDEVAQLAGSFNDAAARIEALVGAQKSLLANASHELRSPLARIRMAVELMQDAPSPAMREELTRNIAELDQLIDEVLLASRLDAGAATAFAPLDLSGIVAEECSRGGAALDAQSVNMTGDARLLRRLVRNLLENAARHGAAAGVEVRLRMEQGTVLLEVCDQGPGVPESERERIFEPFHRLPGASEAAGGVGLGLALVRQIARHHGGSVVCLPGPKGGCCFRVSLCQNGPPVQ